MERYYVYGLYAEEKCFYIGKGTGPRKDSHYRRFCKYRTAVNKLLLSKFISLEKRDIVPTSEILYNNLTSYEAFKIEVSLIAEHGKKHCGGSLCNVLDGGSSPPSLSKLKTYFTVSEIEQIKDQQRQTRVMTLYKLRFNDIQRMKEELLLNKTVKEVAKIIGVTPDTILRWAKTFNIHINGNGKKEANKKHLRAYAERNRVKVQKTSKTYTIEEPDGSVVVINKLVVYCRDRNIDYSNLRSSYKKAKTNRGVKGYRIINVSNN
jgi:transposase-like protein